jgi:hypothetical protein
MCSAKTEAVNFLSVPCRGWRCASQRNSDNFPPFHSMTEKTDGTLSLPRGHTSRPGQLAGVFGCREGGRPEEDPEAFVLAPKHGAIAQHPSHLPVVAWKRRKQQIGEAPPKACHHLFQAKYPMCGTAPSSAHTPTTLSSSPRFLPPVDAARSSQPASKQAGQSLPDRVLARGGGAAYQRSGSGSLRLRAERPGETAYGHNVSATTTARRDATQRGTAHRAAVAAPAAAASFECRACPSAHVHPVRYRAGKPWAIMDMCVCVSSPGTCRGDPYP